MLQGSQLVPLQMNCAADPVTPYCSTLQKDSALLQVRTIMYPKGSKIYLYEISNKQTMMNICNF